MSQQFTNAVKNLFKQKGYLSLISVVLILVFSFLAVTANYLAGTSTQIQQNMTSALQSLYIAESAMELSAAGISSSTVGNGATTSSFDINCLSITGNGFVGNSTTYDARSNLLINYAPENMVWGLTTSRGVQLLDPINITWSEVNSTVDNGNDIEFGNFYDGWIVGDRATVWNLVPPVQGSCLGSNFTWNETDIRSVIDNNRPDLTGVSIVSNDEMWVVGEEERISGTDNYTILKYTKSTNTWCLLLTGSSLPAGSCSSMYVQDNKAYDLEDIHVIDTDGDGIGDLGFAVGSGGNNRGVVLKFNGTVWQDVTTFIADYLNAVYVSGNSSNQKAWVVGRDQTGNDGIIYEWDSSTSNWTKVFDYERTLNAIDMIDTNGDGIADYGWAVGDSGALGEYTGGSWINRSNSLGNTNFTAVKVFAQNDIWIGGNSGRTWHYDGSSWTQIRIRGIGNFVDFGKMSLPGFSAASNWQEVVN